MLRLSQAALGRNGGLDVVVAAMRAHPTAAAVQEQACFALCHLSINAENQVRAARATRARPMRACNVFERVCVCAVCRYVKCVSCVLRSV